MPARSQVSSHAVRIEVTCSPTSFPNTYAFGLCSFPSGACRRSSSTARRFALIESREPRPSSSSPPAGQTSGPDPVRRDGSETTGEKAVLRGDNERLQVRSGVFQKTRLFTISNRTIGQNGRRLLGDDVGHVIPKAAIQTIGDHTVVYLSDPTTPGLFSERTIQTGRDAGDRIAVESGVTAGEGRTACGPGRPRRARIGT